MQQRVATNRQAGQADVSQRPSNVVGDIETDSDVESSEEELESTSQPCPVHAPLVSQVEQWQQPKPFPASYDCWEPAASFSTSSSAMSQTPVAYDIDQLISVVTRSSD